MEFLTKTKKVGRSLVAIIPEVIVEKEGLIENQTVKIDVEKVRKSRFGILNGMWSFTKEDKFKGQLEENN